LWITIRAANPIGDVVPTAKQPMERQMTDENGAIPVAPIEGRMFLYPTPELLTREDHGSLGLTPAEKPFSFAANVRAIPLVVSEIVTAQRHYPVVFSDMENPVPLAIVGLNEDVNLFVGPDGRWDGDAYVPAYLRCHPFALAATQDDKFAIVIDRGAASVVEGGEFPFFEGDEMSANTREMVDFCGKYEGERRKTQQYTERLKELGLLGVRRASHRPAGSDEEETIARYVSVQPEKLGELTAEQVHALHTSGMLAVTFAHLFSLENWLRLVDRRARRNAA
jgi:hypothetical protein